MDLGAGSGILSYFAVKAGAEKVFAVEASGMADKIQKLLDHTGVTNTWLKGKMEVIKGFGFFVTNANLNPGKIEDIYNVQKVDTLISEPIGMLLGLVVYISLGVLLVHERMIESYIVARDRFLKPGGAMVPSMGNIYVAPVRMILMYPSLHSKVL